MPTTDLITAPDLKSALDLAALARQSAIDLLSLLHTLESDSPAGGSVLDHTNAISRQDRIMRAHLAKLRGLNRKAILGTRAMKQGTVAYRQEVDELHLVLQNLYYEQRHLRGEIAACRNYNHKYLELPMVGIDEFLENFPDRANDDEEALTVARIEDEKVQRQALEAERAELEKAKEALKKRNAEQKAELDKLDGDIEKWLNGGAALGKVFEARDAKKAEADEKDREKREKDGDEMEQD